MRGFFTESKKHWDLIRPSLELNKMGTNSSSAPGTMNGSIDVKYFYLKEEFLQTETRFFHETFFSD